ncbi:hypothetical protein RFI_07467 [Reticulomyxa filosa]|uniref:Uncharacterized protein n=1 Tax=Reticulomyxa filosa TaxID=46433 RepID=X6NUS1_RETFI|nr:hypothetical protein RFI_07467 [Reticulomyxa filosa]|eukprot:ETO29653.1 hypothetical protein RFI_07467 [Reticulomyxa filosa]
MDEEDYDNFHPDIYAEMSENFVLQDDFDFYVVKLQRQVDFEEIVSNHMIWLSNITIDVEDLRIRILDLVPWTRARILCLPTSLRRQLFKLYDLGQIIASKEELLHFFNSQCGDDEEDSNPEDLFNRVVDCAIWCIYKFYFIYFFKKKKKKKKKGKKIATNDYLPVKRKKNEDKDKDDTKAEENKSGYIVSENDEEMTVSYRCENGCKITKTMKKPIKKSENNIENDEENDEMEDDDAASLRRFSASFKVKTKKVFCRKCKQALLLYMRIFYYCKEVYSMLSSLRQRRKRRHSRKYRHFHKKNELALDTNDESTDESKNEKHACYVDDNDNDNDNDKDNDNDDENKYTTKDAKDAKEQEEEEEEEEEEKKGKKNGNDDNAEKEKKKKKRGHHQSLCNEQCKEPEKVVCSKMTQEERDANYLEQVEKDIQQALKGRSDHADNNIPVLYEGKDQCQYPLCRNKRILLRLPSIALHCTEQCFLRFHNSQTPLFACFDKATADYIARYQCSYYIYIYIYIYIRFFFLEVFFLFVVIVVYVMRTSGQK